MRWELDNNSDHMKYFKKINPVNKTNLDILHYEVQALNDMADYILKDKNEKNAFLEAFLVHARNLIYFLNDKGLSEDLKISDFQDKENRNMSKIYIDPELVGDDENRIDLYYIHKHVMHLSKKRKEDKFEWSRDEIRKEINRALMEFINNVNEKHYAEARYKRNDFQNLLMNKC